MRLDRGRVHLASVDSTNAEALRRASDLKRGETLWVLADQQTAGRGRRGRPWVSPMGNFYGSWVARLDLPPQVMGLRSFAASLALYDAFAAVTALPEAFALKWPNDVLLNGGKISGILLEASGAMLCIGMGINLISAPEPSTVEPGAVLPVDLLGETGVRISPASFLDALAPAMAHWEDRLCQEGFGALREAWLSRAARLGEKITARTGTMTREGIFETIDGEGNLVLRMAEGPIAIPAAEVFF